jgi:DNA (cytosine-5)-methyltransferase 1
MSGLTKRTAIDLFSGCGGLSQGLKDAEFDVLACCEIRPEARDAYAANHPSAKIFTDIRLLGGNELISSLNLKVGDLDLLAACPPCQGFSSMRTKNRSIADDSRNDLIFDVLRLALDLYPKAILIENVPRLLRDERLSRFKDALKGHYQFSEGVLDAQDFGVPQRRKRMILIGCRLGTIGLPPVGGRKMTVAEALKGIPKPDSKHKRPLHRIRQRFSPRIQKRIAKIKTDRFDLPQNMELPCHKRYPKGFRDVYGRIAWDDVAPTLTRFSYNPSKGRFLHPEENRGLTIYESMILQGFPRRYKFPTNIGIGKLGSLIGEAFPPPMAAAQAKHIHDFLQSIENGFCSDLF